MFKDLDLQTITLLLTFLSGATGIVVTAAIKVITALGENRKLLIAGQQYHTIAGSARDTRIKEIHILVNSRLTTALRLIVTMAKKEYDRTGLADDMTAYLEALKELEQAEEAAKSITSSDTHPEEIQAELARQLLVKLQERKK